MTSLNHAADSAANDFLACEREARDMDWLLDLGIGWHRIWGRFLTLYSNAVQVLSGLKVVIAFARFRRLQSFRRSVPECGRAGSSVCDGPLGHRAYTLPPTMGTGSFSCRNCCWPEGNRAGRNVGEGEKAVSPFSWTGTHRGEFLGIPPTGKSVKVWGVVMNLVRDGVLSESRIIMDTLGLLKQLGAIPAPERNQ